MTDFKDEVEHDPKVRTANITMLRGVTADSS
jgi:hypothetical protein